MNTRSFSLFVFMACSLAAGLAVWADGLPFYKSGSGTTERTSSSAVVSSTSAPLDSRTVQTAASASTVFNSDGVPGMILVIR